MLNSVKLLLILLMFSFASLVHANSKKEDKKEDLVKIHTQLAVAYLENHNLKAALDSANTALAADSRYAQAYLIRAYIYQLAKEYSLAEKDFRETLYLAPKDAGANNNFGWFLCDRSRFDESFVYFRKALSDPFYQTPETAHLNFGICLARQKHFDEADAQLRAALQANPRMLSPIVELARIQYMQGKISSAADYFAKFSTAVYGRMNPDNLLLGAKIYHDLGDANQELKFASELRNKYPYSDQTKQLP